MAKNFLDSFSDYNTKSTNSSGNFLSSMSDYQYGKQETSFSTPSIEKPKEYGFTDLFTKSYWDKVGEEIDTIKTKTPSLIKKVEESYNKG